MKDVVTFETSKRLKEAGFPQPEKGYTGMGIYLDRGGFCIITSVHDHTTMQLLGADVFAPSATDILKEINMHRYSFAWVSGVDGVSGEEYGFWGVFENGDMSHSHINPAEACAAAYLSIHQKSANQ